MAWALACAGMASAALILGGQGPSARPALLANSAANTAPNTALNTADDSAFVADDYRYCTTCHGAGARGNPATRAPRLAGLSRWYVERQIVAFQAGWRGARTSDHPGTALDDDPGGLEMASVATMLADDEAISAAAALVTGMSAPPAAPTLDGGDPVRGAALYDPCVACHGPDGAGVREVGGPALAGQNDWYLKRQMELFRDGLRGAHDADTAGRTMAPFAAPFSDDDALADLIAYINTLSAAATP
ncbi:c-type cytochrome [Rhodothalassium salexigens]|nr:c-type cytochrome [Rhodothalassium salexigens]MBB4210495.1 cytochrome c553 [Rhodothalassium salexigens DSM 2132]